MVKFVVSLVHFTCCNDCLLEFSTHMQYCLLVSLEFSFLSLLLLTWFNKFVLFRVNFAGSSIHLL
jgi:hypothetical protein